jgi:hypothetical protein
LSTSEGHRSIGGFSQANIALLSITFHSSGAGISEIDSRQKASGG